MFKHLKIKREYMLPAGSVLLLLLSYQFAFKRTAVAWQLNKQLNKQSTEQTNLSYQPGYLERKNRNLDKILSKFQTDSVMFRTVLIENIALLAAKHNVGLIDLPADDPAFHAGHYITQRLDFEGDYEKLILLLQDLEYKPNAGVIRAVLFRKPKKDHAGKSALMMSLYLEMFR